MTDFIDFQMNSAGHVILNADLVLLAGNASLEAYTDFKNASNPNYTPEPLKFSDKEFNFVARFTGYDDVLWGSGKEERYVLVYRYSANADVYLFAFRGTSSVYDMVLDLESGLSDNFRPFDKSANFPTSVGVGEGFNKIYSTKNELMPDSMQNQLFHFIENLPTRPKEILVTGHSLGCTLASLFALDVAVSKPEICIGNINFASPRVGKDLWQTTYDETYSLKNRTICIRNSYDLVPKTPFKTWPFGFKHVGQVFPVAFDLSKYHIDFPKIVLAWHSLENYRYVVNRAITYSPQVWTGTFNDQAYKQWEMKSSDPYSKTSELEMSEGIESIKRFVACI